MRNETAPLSPHLQKWLEKVTAYLHDHLHENDLRVKDIAGAFFMSERQFYRRMKTATGHPPNRYLQTLRLQRAKAYLQSGEYATVREVAAAVGFAHAAYFSQLFRNRYGHRPMHYFSRKEPIGRNV